MRIIGIDPGTQCGYAWTDTGKASAAQSGVWNLKPRRLEGGGMRFARFRKYLLDLLDEETVLFFEEVASHKGTAAAHIYGGLVAIISELCESREIPYRGIPVGTIKKRATGKGNAGKPLMVAAACEAWGPVEDDNQADALWVLQCGLDYWGED